MMKLNSNEIVQNFHPMNICASRVLKTGIHCENNTINLLINVSFLFKHCSFNTFEKIMKFVIISNLTIKTC